MNYGICDGGPFDGRPLAHPEARYLVAIELFGRRVRVGAMPTATDCEFGVYRFKDGEWTWEPPANRPSAAKIV